jgi:hypothetical protein
MRNQTSFCGAPSSFCEALEDRQLLSVSFATTRFNFGMPTTTSHANSSLHAHASTSSGSNSASNHNIDIVGTYTGVVRIHVPASSSGTGTTSGTASASNRKPSSSTSHSHSSTSTSSNNGNGSNNSNGSSSSTGSTTQRRVTLTIANRSSDGLVTGTLDIANFATFNVSGFANGKELTLVLNGEATALSGANNGNGSNTFSVSGPGGGLLTLKINNANSLSGKFIEDVNGVVDDGNVTLTRAGTTGTSGTSSAAVARGNSGSSSHSSSSSSNGASINHGTHHGSTSATVGGAAGTSFSNTPVA